MIELRSDAIKICYEMRRPVPWRTDSIGPWLDNLGFLTWLGCITSASLVFLFSGNESRPEGSPFDITAWSLLLCLIMSEHIYYIVRLLVRYGFSRFESTGLQQVRREQFLIRKLYLSDLFGAEAAEAYASSSAVFDGPQDINEMKKSDEKGDGKSSDGFWESRLQLRDSLDMGMDIIRQRMANSKSKKA
jgi:anoctamin-10